MPLIFFLLAFNVRARAFEIQVVPSDSLTLRELFDKDTFNEKNNCNLKFVIHCLCEYVSKWMCILWSHRSDSSDFSSSSFQCQGNSYWGLSCLIHRFCWSFLIRQLHLWARNNQCFVVIDNKGSRSLFNYDVCYVKSIKILSCIHISNYIENSSYINLIFTNMSLIKIKQINSWLYLLKNMLL